MSAARQPELIGLLFLALCAGSAAGHEQVEKHGPTSVSLHLDRTSVALSDDHLTLTLTVEGPAPLEVDAPTPLAEPREAWMQRPTKPTLVDLPNRRQRWQQKCELEPRLDRDVPLQVGALLFRAGNADQRTEQTWKSISVRVTHRRLSTNPEEASLEKLQGISPIESVPGPPENPSWLRPMLAVTTTMILLGLAVWLRRRTVEAVPEPTPAETALVALDGIDALDLTVDGQIERFHVLVADVLRRYLEKRFALAATGKTTPEFLDSLRRSSLLTMDQQESLHSFLNQCDLAKFARAEFSAGECKSLVRQARELIQQTEPSAAAPVNGQVTSR